MKLFLQVASATILRKKWHLASTYLKRLLLRITGFNPFRNRIERGKIECEVHLKACHTRRPIHCGLDTLSNNKQCTASPAGLPAAILSWHSCRALDLGSLKRPKIQEGGRWLALSLQWLHSYFEVLNFCCFLFFWGGNRNLNGFIALCFNDVGPRKIRRILETIKSALKNGSAWDTEGRKAVVCWAALAANKQGSTLSLMELVLLFAISLLSHPLMSIDQCNPHESLLTQNFLSINGHNHIASTYNLQRTHCCVLLNS